MKKELSQYPALLTIQAWTIKDLLHSKNILLNNQEWLVYFKSLERKAICISCTINPLELFMLFLFWMPSATFCNSITKIVQKWQTLKVCSMHFFSLHEINADNPKQAIWAHLAHSGYIICFIFLKGAFSYIIIKVLASWVYP